MNRRCHLLIGEELGKVDVLPAGRPQLLQLPLGRLHVVQLEALEHGQRLVRVLRQKPRLCVSRSTAPMRRLERIASTVPYLEEGHPRDFVVALHRVPEVVLQRPELSIQVVVDGDGAKKRTNNAGEQLHSWGAVFLRVCDVPRRWRFLLAHLSFLHLHAVFLIVRVLP